MRNFEKLDLGKLRDGDTRAMEILERLRREWESNRVKKRAPVNPSLNGARIRIPGFVVPLESGREEVREFLFVPYFGACIHVPPPPVNNIIHVFPSKAVKGIHAMDGVLVSGELTVKHSNTEWVPPATVSRRRTLFLTLNHRIDDGDNKHIKVSGRREKRRWNLLYPTPEEPVNSPFNGQLPGIGMADQLARC